MATPTIQQVVAELEMALANHLPYVFGGTSLKTGADCSGVIYAALIAVGVKSPARTSQAQFAAWAHAPGPAYGVAVFFNVPSDGPPQPQHVGVCLTGSTMFQEPHTGLDAEITNIPNIPGVESIMGYRYLPVSYGTPNPPPPGSTPPAHLPQEFKDMADIAISADGTTVAGIRSDGHLIVAKGGPTAADWNNASLSDITDRGVATNPQGGPWTFPTA